MFALPSGVIKHGNRKCNTFLVIFLLKPQFRLDVQVPRLMTPKRYPPLTEGYPPILSAGDITGWLNAIDRWLI